MQRKLNQLLVSDEGSPLSDCTVKDSTKLVANYSITLQDAPLSSATPTQLASDSKDSAFETEKEQRSIHSKSNAKLRNSLRELRPTDAQRRIVEVLKKGDEFATPGETLLRIVFVKKTLRNSQLLLDNYRAACDRYGIGLLLMSDIENVLHTGSVFFIPDLHAPSGASVLWVDINSCQLAKEKFQTDCLTRCLLCILEAMMNRETAASRHGIVIVIKANNLKITSLLDFSQIASSLQNCFPALVKSILVVDIGSVSSVLATPFLRYFTSKIRSRIHFIKSEALIQHIGSLSNIPVEFGGSVKNGLSLCAQAVSDYLKDSNVSGN
eukprot:TRINITY_DN5742_c2_g4_i1.p1 TRINITY_DN5742_c2_g4~~TRINITY_DN5742_c2_g4_i1.p1  ORF type:complete len:378 (+),score=78.63 TRINITY_DN5742_c2_g4_i1:164-1135(+)